MKGLLTKDLYFAFQRKQTLIIFFAICVIMGFSSGLSFVVGFMSFISVIIAISTISYDEADNGMLFLMTLPVDRKTYVYSKYVLGTVFAAAGWLLGAVVGGVLGMMQGMVIDLKMELLGAAAVLLISLLALDVMVPLQLKFGAEKSRIVFLAVFGVCFAILFIAGRILQSTGSSVLRSVEYISESTMMLALIVLYVAGTVISVRSSVHIMENKKF